MYQRLAQFNNFFGKLPEDPVTTDPVDTDQNDDSDDQGDQCETSQDQKI